MTIKNKVSNIIKEAEAQRRGCGIRPESLHIQDDYGAELLSNTSVQMEYGEISF